MNNTVSTKEHISTTHDNTFNQIKQIFKTNAENITDNQIKQIFKTNAENIIDNVQYETVKNLKLTADVVTSVDLNGIGSSGTVNIEIDNELNFTSENPVQNKIITEAISNLSSNKLDLSAYVVDPTLNNTSTNPVQNKAIQGLINDILNRISQIEYLNNIKLSYSTHLEVFATRTDLSAGTSSSKTARIDRMLAQTNKWSKTKDYPKDTIVTEYDHTDESLTQQIGIYKSRTSVPVGIQLDNNEYWENLTEKYLHTERDEKGNIKKYYHRFIDPVPKGTKQTLVIKSETRPEDQNTVIRWGDNTPDTNLRSASIDENTEELTCKKDNNGYIYTCTHDYTQKLIADGLQQDYYMIEIVGNKFSILTSKENVENEEDRNNIISNIFGDNMQFYVNCIDIAGLLKGSKKILYVSCADYNNALFAIRNSASLFEDCTNLQYAIGFYELTGLNTMISIERMFANCKNMLNCDFRIAKSVAINDENDTGYNEVFLNCENMSSRLRALLPTNGFDSKIITLNSTFKNCKNIYIIDATGSELNEFNDVDHINNILFKDDSKIFQHNNTFAGCTLLDHIDADFIPSDWK